MQPPNHFTRAVAVVAAYLWAVVLAMMIWGEQPLVPGGGETFAGVVGTISVALTSWWGWTRRSRTLVMLSTADATPLATTLLRLRTQARFRRRSSVTT